MNREEILAKSREENLDEGFIEAANKGRRLGIHFFSFVLLFFQIFNLFTLQHSFEASALLWVYIAAETYPKYKFTSKIHYLIISVFASLICIANIVIHVLTTFGIEVL